MPTAREEVRPAREALRAALAEYPTTMWGFVGLLYGARATSEAWAEFTLWKEGAGRFDWHSPFVQSFSSWFFHCWIPHAGETSVTDPALRGRPPTAVFLEKMADEVHPVLRRYLAGCVGMPFSFHEIVWTDTRGGVLTQDIISGQQFELRSRADGRTTLPGDILFAQIVETEGIGAVAVCCPIVIGAAHKDEILKLRPSVSCGRHQRCSPEALRKWDLERRELYWMIARERSGVVKMTAAHYN